MTATTAAPPRIETLDLVRGVAVMGILAMNIVAFSMPFAAYLNPVAYGTEGAADLASWLFSFIFIDGKMRGLFSLLFGASMLLVIERAEAKQHNAASVHFRRMAWLLLFGLLHTYFIWFGDILTQYALVGMIAWHFRHHDARSLCRIGVTLLLVHTVLHAGLAALTMQLERLAASPEASAAVISEWRGVERRYGLDPQALAEQVALYQGSYGQILAYTFQRYSEAPVWNLIFLGAETLAYILFGMAALRSGFLTGNWETGLYRKVAAVGLAVTIPAYAALAAILFADDFGASSILAVTSAATVPFRPPMVLAYAALIILLTRKGGWLADRIAAAGRAAFTNYLGTSIVMTAVFYGWGLGFYGTLSRVELWLVMIAACGVMLAWSKPWLDRFAYGPFEWLWRSLARWELQPMRRRTAADESAET